MLPVGAGARSSVDAKETDKPGVYKLVLVALPTREVFLEMVDGQPRAVIYVEGKRVFLNRIYVHAKEGWTGPTVQYVVLHGVDAETGEAVQEVMRP